MNRRPLGRSGELRDHLGNGSKYLATSALQEEDFNDWPFPGGY